MSLSIKQYFKIKKKCPTQLQHGKVRTYFWMENKAKSLIYGFRV